MNRNKRTKNIKANEAINNMGFVNSIDILSLGESDTKGRNHYGKKQIHRNKS